MANATIPGGSLININDCYIVIPHGNTRTKINLKILPEITDSKGATYNDEVIMGRSNPLKTFNSSENRSISMQLHFMATERNDFQRNLNALRLIESAVYPSRDVASNTGAPFVPPPICNIKCGKILGEESLCAILLNYNVRFPTDVPWDESTLLPYKFDIDTSWNVVYRSTDLPGQERIISKGH